MTSKPVSLLKFKSKLTTIFFSKDAPIEVYSEEYDNFWKFLHKFEKRVRERSKSPAFKDQTKLPSVPCWDKPASELLSRIVVDQDEASHLTQKDVETTRDALLTYVAFLRSQEEKRRQKLKQFQDGLPIASYRDELISSVKSNQVILVAGDTGCGKSTQVPRYLLEEGYEGIIVTQPRRLAAIALASRVSVETGSEMGNLVGYQIRFERKISKNTKLTFMTEGLLLRLLSSASADVINNHKIIILDEIHERHISCDFLLGLIKCLVVQNEDLRVILMSATANLQLFSNYFDDCLVIEVPGRLFPVEVKYISPDQDRDSRLTRKRSKIDPAPYLKVLSLIEQTVAAEERGDVLIFLSGAQEISCLQEELEGREGWIVLPLHSALPIKQQDKVFLSAPEGMRKCILSTNIAETSVTIDGVRFVVDSGKVKEMTYDASCRMQKLKEFWCSKASAQQRKGRAGRTGPGQCFRLYSEKQFDEMEDYSEPEVRRVPLHSLVLQLVQLGLANVREFPFLDKPDLDSLEHSICTLVRQGALTSGEALTAMGKILAQLPVDLNVGKVLLLGCMFRELLEASLTIAAALSIPSPLSHQSFRDYETIRRRKDLEDDRGDPLMTVRVYHEWLQLKLDDRESSQRWCRRRGIEEQRLYELTKLRSQFLRILKEAKLYDIPEASMSSSERARRHGEVHHLRDLRKEAVNNEKRSRKRKLVGGPGGDDEDDDEHLDVKDIDFRLAQDGKTLRRLLRKSSEISASEKATLLWILAAGLYPQVALSDTHNSYKKDSDQLFHTDSKGFVTLHPNSVLALNPEVLRLDDSDVVAVEGGFSVSSKHQMLAYMSLLETTKPYLVNCIRLPTLQYILLLAGEIHTSPCLRRISFDSIIEVRIYESPGAELRHNLLLRVLLARLMFQRVFQRMLQESTREGDEGEEGISSETRRLSRRLLRYVGEVLMNFRDVCYTQKRLLPADLKTMFVNDSLEVCGFLHLGSLESPEDTSMREPEETSTSFRCPVCEESHVTFASCAVHLGSCALDETSGNPAAVEADNPNEGYFCKKCLKSIGSDAAFDILKHNRECQGSH